MIFPPIFVQKIVMEDELKYKGQKILRYKIEYPVFSSRCYDNCLFKVNQFYSTKAHEYKKYCETELFKMAIEQYNDAIENNFPVRVFEAILIFKIAYLQGCIISTYSDRYEYTGGAHGNTIRDSQTWNLRNCSPIGLDQLVTCQPNYKAYILALVASQIKTNPAIYFENYTELIVKTFNLNSFYCTPEGIIIYYQQYDIAPYSSGIREFLIPYSDCVMNPIIRCL